MGTNSDDPNLQNLDDFDLQLTGLIFDSVITEETAAYFTDPNKPIPKTIDIDVDKLREALSSQGADGWQDLIQGELSSLLQVMARKGCTPNFIQNGEKLDPYNGAIIVGDLLGTDTLKIQNAYIDLAVKKINASNEESDQKQVKLSEFNTLRGNLSKKFGQPLQYSTESFTKDLNLTEKDFLTGLVIANEEKLQPKIAKERTEQIKDELLQKSREVAEGLEHKNQAKNEINKQIFEMDSTQLNKLEERIKMLKKDMAADNFHEKAYQQGIFSFIPKTNNEIRSLAYKELYSDKHNQSRHELKGKKDIKKANNLAVYVTNQIQTEIKNRREILKEIVLFNENPEHVKEMKEFINDLRENKNVQDSEKIKSRLFSKLKENPILKGKSDEVIKSIASHLYNETPYTYKKTKNPVNTTDPLKKEKTLFFSSLPKIPSFRNLLTNGKNGKKPKNG